MALRTFDDGAKIVGRRTRDLNEWWDVAHRVYSGKGKSTIDLVEAESLDSIEA